MKIQLKNLVLINFKGIKNKSISLNPDGQSFIFGDNATGKTTVFDSFTWLLFGKDSQGRTDFEIKTIEGGSVIEQLDHEVTGTIIVDGKETVIKRILREKWVKKRGSESVEFEGNETLLFVNDVPKKANEFKDFISSLVDERLFKLITSPTAFNSLPWQERRTILTSICGGMSNDEIVSQLEATPDQKQWLLNLLASGDSLADQKKAIATKIKKFKDELKTIPTRIDEAERSKPLLLSDTSGTSGKIEKLNAELVSIDEKILDKSKAFDGEVDEINLRKKNLVSLQTKINNRSLGLKMEAEREVAERNKLPNKLKSELDSIVNNIESKNREIKTTSDLINELVEQGEAVNISIQDKRDEWTQANARVFKHDPTSLCCPTCKQELKDKDQKISELQANFNTRKAEQLDSINSQGATLKKKFQTIINNVRANNEKLEGLTEAMQKLVDEKTAKQLELDATKQDTVDINTLILEKQSADIELMNMKDQEKELEQLINSMTEALDQPNTADFQTKKTEIKTKIEELKVIQSQIDEVKKANDRIAELKAQEKSLAHEQAQIERDEFLISKFNKTLIDSIESKVNSMFDIVRFKMFEQQINGGETETCVCTVNGVSYPDLNNAMKIQAGLDIIKTLSNFYKVSAPIFIDNRESVVDIGEQTAQIINLVVSEQDKELRVV